MSSTIKKGILLTLEGIDGSGKSSAVQALSRALSSHYKVICTREPGATVVGTSIRELVQHSSVALCPRAEFLLFAADRAHHCFELVLPHIRNGYIVISDRMADSSLAYQGYGRGLDKEFIRMVNAWALQGVRPDLTLYLRIDYDKARERIEKRAEKKTTLESEHAAFFQRVSEGFDMLFKDRTDVRVIDASQSEEKVHADCIEQVISFLTSREL